MVGRVQRTVIPDARPCLLSIFSEFLRKPEPIDFENYEHHYHRKNHHMILHPRNWKRVGGWRYWWFKIRVPRAVMENIESYYKNDYVFLRIVLILSYFCLKWTLFTSIYRKLPTNMNDYWKNRQKLPKINSIPVRRNYNY